MKGTFLASVTLLLTIAKIISITSAQYYSPVCTIGSYDLSPLTIPNILGSPFYNISINAGNSETYTYYFNICGGVYSEYCKQNDYASVCQLSSLYPTQRKCGQSNSQTLEMIDESQGVILTYTDGDICPGVSGTPPRTTIITLLCSTTIGTEVLSVSESSCVYSITMKSNFACPVLAQSPTPSPSSSRTPSIAPSPSLSPSPSPTYYPVGYDACNSIKVSNFPFSYTTNLQLGTPYNGTCIGGQSVKSQFYLVRSSLSGIVTANTCSTSPAFDTMIRVYQSAFCSNLGTCIAENDDGCSATNLSSVGVSIQANRDYYFEVRTYGTSFGDYYTIDFSLQN